MKAALIGCGGAGASRHLPVLNRIAGVELVAVADLNRERAEQAARKFSIPRAYTDYREMLDKARPDVVAVSVPAPHHREVACAVLAAGRHLFLEKPLAANLDDCHAILAAARAGTSRATVGFNLRWHRLVRRARERIRAGEVGSVQLVRSVFTSPVRFIPSTPPWRRDRARGGGVFFEISVHHFDLWRFVLGAEIGQVWAASTDHEDWQDDRGAVMARLSNGALATLMLSQSTRVTNELAIYGDAAQLTLLCNRFDGLDVIPSGIVCGDVGFRLKRLLASIAQLPAALPSIRAGGDWAASYRGEWEHYLSAIRGETELETTLEDGLRATEAALRAMEATSSTPVAPPLASH